MIEFINQTNFEVPQMKVYAKWIARIFEKEDRKCGDIIYTFCSDEFLDELNQHYLQHVDWTDIITFDNTVGDIVSGDIFISLDRVQENALKFGVDMVVELRRVMAHGILHLFDYKDDTENNQSLMRLKENEMLNLFHVEH